jgi:hypothetical protein
MAAMPETNALTESEEKFFTSKGEEGGSEPESGTGTEQVESATGTAPDAVPPVDKKAGVEDEFRNADGSPKMVEKAALKEERDRRKAERQAKEEAQRKVLTLETRFKTLEDLARAPAKAQAEPEVPDINTDPVGHFKAKTAQLERELADTRKWRQEQEQQSSAINNVQRISQLAQAQEGEFKKITPDYDDASGHLRSLRDAQLVAYGVSDPQERLNIIAQDAITIAAQALSTGKNPAQVIYDMAKASGYQGKTPVATQAAPQSGKGPSEEEKVKKAAKWQVAGGSLGQMNGASQTPTTLEMISRMSDDEFAEATKGEKWRKLFGA